MRAINIARSPQQTGAPRRASEAAVGSHTYTTYRWKHAGEPQPRSLPYISQSWWKTTSELDSYLIYITIIIIIILKSNIFNESLVRH